MKNKVKARFSRGHVIRDEREFFQMEIDTTPGTDLTYAPQAMRDRWYNEGWGHFTIHDLRKGWGEQGKVVHNGCFLSLEDLEHEIQAFKNWDVLRHKLDTMIAAKELSNV